MKNKVYGSQKGFTLIELLIVITIIGILAAALLPNVFGATAKARDAARLTALNQVVQALESYNADNAGYPDAVSGALDPAKMKQYFQGSQIPKDPKTGLDYMYCKATSSALFSYLVGAVLENPTGKAQTDVTNFNTACNGNAFPVANGTATANVVYYIAK